MTQRDMPHTEGGDAASADDSGSDERDSWSRLRDGLVPSWLATSSAVAWRFLVVAAAIVLLGVIASRFQVIVVPLLIAAMLAAVLVPPARWLMDRGWPALLSTWTVVLVAAIVLGGLGWLLYPTVTDGFSNVGTALEDAYGTVREWLIDGPLNLDPDDVDQTEQRISDALGEALTSDLASRAAIVVEIVTGFFLTLVIAFFYIKDGNAMSDYALARVPDNERDRVASSLKAGWSTLQRYLVGVVVVGAADAVIIGVGLWILGVPYVIPVMVLTFLGAFFPLVGAILAGAVATLLALGSGGLGTALLVVALTIVVQQLDGDVIAPLVYSKAVALHPLAILLALTAGSVIAGIIGAFLAVPIMAVSVAALREYQSLGP